MTEPPGWRDNGLRIVRGGELDTNTLQTPGMTRAAAINQAKAGAENILGAGAALNTIAFGVDRHLHTDSRDQSFQT